MANPLSKLISPNYPNCAIGIERGLVSLVQLERVRGNVCKLRRAASVELSESLVRPHFDQSNISDLSELAGVLNDLALSAGLLKHRKWSVALPEATARTMIVTLESPAGSGSELEEILTWKIERGFGVPMDELTVSQELLTADGQGRDRYQIIAARNSILAEYESVFSSLGWRAGLLLPRHMGEAQWLTINGFQGDGLLLSAAEGGFTAVVYRDKQPLIFRSVACDADECEDELYRLLLFYRDRRTEDSEQVMSRILVLGEGFPKERALALANETLGTRLRLLDVGDLGLELPNRQISFDTIAAPAGLATLSWQ
jgi:hypothetical protein